MSPERRPSLGRLLCDLVDIDSITGNEKEVMLFLEDRVKRMGASVTRFPMGEGRYNLLASIGSGSPVLCLNAHADTMPPSGQSVPRSVLEKGTVRGLGSCDDKASVASMLLALHSLARLKLKGRVDLLVSIDEEVSSNGVRTCVQNGYRCDFAIVGEPTALAPVTAHSGLVFLDLITKGTGGHGSSPWHGKNAVVSMFELYRDLDGLVSTFPAHALVGRPSTNLGIISGGDATNRIPDRCHASVDVRVMPGMSVSDAIEKMRKLVEGRDAEFRVYKRGDPMESDRGSKLLDEVLSCEDDVLGASIPPIGFRGWTEADPFRNLLGADTLVLGPGEIARSHSPNEFVELAQVEKAQRIYEGVARRLLGEESR